MERDLYSRTSPAGDYDSEIEGWLSEAIEGPFDAIFNKAFDLGSVQRKPFRGDPKRAAVATELGFKLNGYKEWLPLGREWRLVISKYVSALLVRNPIYLRKIKYKLEERSIAEGDDWNVTLDEMLRLYELYLAVIQDADFFLIVRECDAEYLYSDAGIIADEPWNRHMPFDIHVPLTPEISLQVLPVPNSEIPKNRISVGRAGKRVIIRQNRISLGSAKEFVFSRGEPPLDFISKYFGISPPAPFGFRVINGQFEVKYVRDRDAAD